MTDTAFDRSAAIIEDALRTMPAAPVPKSLRSRVMRRVKSSVAPRFAFPWLEGAVSLMLSALLTVLAYLLIGMNPYMIFRLEQAVRMFFMMPTNRPVLTAAIPVLGMLAMCLLLTMWIFRPRRRPGARVMAAR
ncbi:MAG: hypothetical protein ACK2UB_12925 [Anaerolineales bacterium]|jgi:hypothetical protein